MRLYSASSREFIEDNVRNQIADKMKEAFFKYLRYNPSPNEVNSWRNSLRALSLLFQSADLLDHGIILEYQLPMTSKRLDCLICGSDFDNNDNAVIIELKQWDFCKEAPGENEVITWVGKGEREVLHPAVQVKQYKTYLEDTHTSFNGEKDKINLSGCTYLHNFKYLKEAVLFSNKFSRILAECPIFMADDTEKMSTYLKAQMDKGDGLRVLDKINKGKYQPSKKLLDHVGNIIKNKSEYILLDEQLVVYDKVLSLVKEGFDKDKKTVIVVKGGPGTGKSVIAMNLLADLCLKGYNTHYATGSKAFTETLRKIIGAKGAAQFKYFNSYTEAKENEIDVLVADEAHRIRINSNSRFTPKTKRSIRPQIEELLRVARLGVFFIDDNQIVRPDEIGSTEYIKSIAEKNNFQYLEYELEAQFRCNGSDAFVNWVNNTLGIKRTANVIWDLHEEFDFRIFDNPKSLHEAIKEKNKEKPNSARIVTGYCWPWSEPNHDGTLVDDVVIGNFKMPWEKKDKFWEWAHEDSGMDQMGTVYTAQGFEFDYIGVIVAQDLAYNFDSQHWEGHPENSHDLVAKRSREKFTEMVKNVYRVLMSRGMKGCYVYFIDKDTERFFKSRIE